MTEAEEGGNHWLSGCQVVSNEQTELSSSQRATRGIMGTLIWAFRSIPIARSISQRKIHVDSATFALSSILYRLTFNVNQYTFSL